MDLVVGSGPNPQLTVLTIDPDGRIRTSIPTAIPIKPVDWTIDFQLPERVRVGEELVVDVALTNGLHNCSQVRANSSALCPFHYNQPLINILRFLSIMNDRKY